MDIRFKLIPTVLLTGIFSLLMYGLVPEPFNAFSIATSFIGGLVYRGFLDD